MNKAKLLIIPFSFLLFSCAKMPVKTIDLTNLITQEGKRMHQLNIALTNKMFKEKSLKIDDFIQNKYTPEYINDFTKKIPEGTDLLKELPDILKSLIPEINARRDMMQRTLEEQRIKLVTKLEQDYLEYNNLCLALQKQIESVVKVDEERHKAFSKAKELSSNKLDLNQLETSIDNFITNSGTIGENINTLNATIDTIINK